MMSRPTLLILGARGFVGGWLARLAPEVFDVAPTNSRVDITDQAACQGAIDRARPNLVAHLAAVSDIDRCERNPGLAESVNVRGAENVARACRNAGARMIFTSSGAVFDGTSSAYDEDHPPSPLNVYGRTKALAEEAVLATLPDAIVVRLSLVLGMAITPDTNAVVDKLVTAWQAGRTVGFPADEHRNALDVETVVSFVLELAGSSQAHGIYHIGSADALSRFQIGRGLAQALDYPAALVAPETEPAPGRAPRGRFEFLRTDKIARICRTPVPTCESAIRRCAHATAQSRP